MNHAVSSGWGKALSVFADRRAVIMLFLGFSAGIPILLIFSSLSLWLGEAGIEKKAVTFFSWAALGYSFKFVWAPLIDELPVPFLTKILGKRRSWLLVAQLLIISAIAVMAMSDPAQGHDSLVQMAIGAVLLGFSAATQDIVIDAYRIELAEPEMQSALAATYNAGYRIGMIIAGAGALYLAAGFGTAKGNYIYEAWQYTYLIMAAVMLIGVATTLIIREPVVKLKKHQHGSLDYFRLVAVFAVAVASFIATFILVGQYTSDLNIEDTFLSFLIETARFLSAALVAVLVGVVLVKLKVVNQQIAKETWVDPLLDFFKRYGVKLALTLLLLIGFYRISDILSGVISNVFYQDLNFTKEQIATAVKVYGVLFTLVGGFLGGLLAQRFNVMKVMFGGAILASITNLIFIGLVKSGLELQPVELQINGQTYSAQPNEVGAWKIELPQQVFQQASIVDINARTSVVQADGNTLNLQNSKQLAVGNPQSGFQNYVRDIGFDNTVYANQDAQDTIVSGQVYNLQPNQTVEKVSIHLGGETIEAKLKDDLNWSAVVPAKTLMNQAQQGLMVNTQVKTGDQSQTFATSKTFQSSTAAVQPQHLDFNELNVIHQNDHSATIAGKVIVPYSKAWLYFAIVMDNLASGLAGAAFIAFLSSLTSVSFTAVQYAIFSSLMTLTPKILGGYSGTIVENIGYPNFFLMTTLVGLPILILIVLVNKALQRH